MVAAGNADVQKVRATIEQDLVRSGHFVALAPERLAVQPGLSQPVPYAQLQASGLEYLVVVGLRDEAGQRVGITLTSLPQQKQLFARNYPVEQPEAVPAVAHRGSGLILEAVLGLAERGTLGTSIAYVSVSRSGGDLSYRLQVADEDGSNARTLARSRDPLMTPAWSPDGTRLAYVGFEGGRSAIYICDLASGHSVRVISEPGINGSPAWSPDGSRLAVTLSFEHNPDIYLIDPDTGNRRRITFSPGIDTEAAWSPDGQTIAFTSDRSGTARVYTMNADGSGVRPMPAYGKQTSNPRFSPDGRSLAMVIYQGHGSRIGLLHLDTDRFEYVSGGPRDESPSFAPDGSRLLYSSQDERLGALKIRGADGVTQEISDGEDLREAAWSPYLN